MKNEHLYELVTELERLLTNARNPERAPRAEAYMKNRFPFFGMETGVRRTVQNPWITALKTLHSREDRWELIRALWSKEEREFHYAAQDWLNTWPKKWFSEEDADELKWLITQQSWWDSVDTIASNYLGKWALLFPEKAREAFEEWRYESSFWLQRSCLIYQLKYKDHVDVHYLESLIEQLLPQKEFFIQKAIGWSLRQLSKYKPEEVRRILETYPVKGLALKEASKYLE
jgi:3-methyladenine DNA glycosylase AlkD